MAGQGKGWIPREADSGSDSQLRKDIVAADSPIAKDTVFYMKKANFDQYIIGERREHFATGHEVCPVQALKEYYGAFPERRTGWEEATCSGEHCSRP